MAKYLARRLLSMVPVIVVVLLIVFLLVELTPGDAAVTLAGENASAEQIEDVRRRLDLDEPLVNRMLDYAGDVVRGDLGTSLLTSRRVVDLIAETWPITASLAIVALVIVVLLGLGGGVIAALRYGGLVDRLMTALTSLGTAIPAFVFAFLLLVPFAVDRSLLPSVGFAPLSDGLWEWLRHLILPGLALAIPSAAELARQVRGALVDTFQQDYIRSKYASGLSTVRVVGKHALRNAAIPIVTVLGLQVGRIIGSAVVVEKVFAIPGLGSLSFRAALGRDVPLIQGLVLFVAAVVLLVNLVVDISYGYLNPRLRQS